MKKKNCHGQRPTNKGLWILHAQAKMTMISGPEERGRPREWWGSGAKTKMLLLLLWWTVRTWTRWCDHNDEATTAFLYSVLNRFHPLHFTCKSTPLLDILGIFGALQSALFLFQGSLHASQVRCTLYSLLQNLYYVVRLLENLRLAAKFISQSSGCQCEFRSLGVYWTRLSLAIPIPPISIHTLDNVRIFGKFRGDFTAEEDAKRYSC